MYTKNRNKYKDDSPLNTINRIRNILTDLGVLTVENSWQNSGENYYSVNLSIANTNISTNGKGTSEKYALASAYGELMERLQNQSFFRLNVDLSDEALLHGGFFYAPDEVGLSFEDFINSKEDWIAYQTKNRTTKEVQELLKLWHKISYEVTPNDFIALPYMNINTRRISNIPIKMISKMYMSNGMCAGNSREEALVQGISEIYERYVNKYILLNKITPPTIPKSYIKKYPKILEMINQIEQSGSYKVYLKDCSLDKGYPVIGVVLINTFNHTYFVKFGAHPIFSIAAERTLTELLQGQNIRNIMGVKEFSYFNPVEDVQNNLIGILVNGSGYYPTEFFSSKASYNFYEFEDNSNLNNKEMLKHMINNLKNQGFDVYIRDVSFLGFPSYHVIIPGFSEIDSFDDIESLEKYIDYNTAKELIRKHSILTERGEEALIEFFNSKNYKSDVSINELINIPCKMLLPWYYTKVDLFLTALHVKRGEHNRAYERIDRFVKNLSNSNYPELQKSYYKCARDYIGFMNDNKNNNEAFNFLNLFYSGELINAVLLDFGDCNNIMKKYGIIKCFNCKKCDLKQKCTNANREKVLLLLKKKYLHNVVNQKNLLS